MITVFEVNEKQKLEDRGQETVSVANYKGDLFPVSEKNMNGLYEFVRNVNHIEELPVFEIGYAVILGNDQAEQEILKMKASGIYKIDKREIPGDIVRINGIKRFCVYGEGAETIGEMVDVFTRKDEEQRRIIKVLNKKIDEIEDKKYILKKKIFELKNNPPEIHQVIFFFESFVSNLAKKTENWINQKKEKFSCRLYDARQTVVILVKRTWKLIYRKW